MTTLLAGAATSQSTRSSAGGAASDVFASTWRALLVPRRLLALAAVATPLVAAQRFFGGGAVEVGIACVMVLLFLALGPATWRLLFTGAHVRLPLLVRLLFYAGVGAGVVFALGLGVTHALDVGTRFLMSPMSLLISSAFFWVGGFGLGRDIELEDRLARTEREAERARLMALKSHLDPHFVFNTLNAIAEWCRTDGEVAERAILQLSDILRAVLAGVKAEAWPVAKERALLESLTALHLMRDKNLFALDLRVDPRADDAMIPPLLLLPLVENAVKHGPAAGHRGALLIDIGVDGEVDAGGLRVVVENPGPYRGRRAGGEGIAMVESRLALFTGGRGALTMEDVDGQRTRATIVVPAPAKTGAWS